jgi:hypothetical protein
MKYRILFFVLLLPLQVAFSQCPTDSILRVKYDRDVKDLALRRIRLFKHPDTMKIDIPQIWQDTIWDGLAALFRSQGIPERDTVFDIFCIHHSSPRESAITNGVYIKSTTAWTYDSLNLQIRSGNPLIDSLLAQAGVLYHSKLLTNVIHGTFTRVINAQVVCDSLERFQEVVYAESTASAGDGNKIRYNILAGEQHFEFQLGWEDCLSGCIFYRIWKFKVKENCVAEYLGRSDFHNSDYFPSPSNCKITTALDEPEQGENGRVVVFPNPFRDKIQIATGQTGSASARLVDLSGREVLENRFFGKISLDTSVLLPGLYVLQVVSGQRNTVFKVIKSAP